jgi:hypothetical protein
MREHLHRVIRLLVGSHEVSVLCLLLLAVPVPSGAQGDQATSPGLRAIAAPLSRAGVRVDTQARATDNQPALEVRVRWNAYITTKPRIHPGGAKPTRGGGFVIKNIRYLPEPVVLPRAPELSADALLVAAVDRQEQLRGWSLVTDPRILRQEQPGPNKELKGQVLHHTKPELLITLPNDPAITELRFYTPIRSEQGFVLQLLGKVPFRPEER